MPSAPVTGNDPAAVTTPDPAAAPAAAPQYVGREELAGLMEGIRGALQTHAQSINQAVSGRGAAQPAPAPQPTPTPAEQNNILMRLAEGDLSPVDQRVIETLRGTGVIDFLATQANSTADANVAAARGAIDAEFGTGVYDKELKPIVDQILGDSRTARANPSVFNNAVAAAKGMRFNELSAAKSAKDTAAAAARTAEETRMRANMPWMPGNGFTPTQPNVLSEDDAATLRRMASQTGDEVTPKPEQAAQLRDMLWQSGHDGVSIADLARRFPAAR